MKLLVDSDFLFGLFVQDDPHHFAAPRVLQKCQKSAALLVLNVVLQEAATVLSHKADQQTSLRFLTEFPKLQIQEIRLTEEIEEKAWDLFKKQTKNKTSFIDCANLAAIEYYKLDGILSFDMFYPKKVRVS